MSRVIEVRFTKEELAAQRGIGELDLLLLHRLREAGVPVIGTYRFEGVRHGVVNVSTGVATWYESVDDARAAGVW